MFFRKYREKGTHFASLLAMAKRWIPAFAGMTERGAGIQKKNVPHDSCYSYTAPVVKSPSFFGKIFYFH